MKKNILYLKIIIADSFLNSKRDQTTDIKTAKAETLTLLPE